MKKHLLIAILFALTTAVTAQNLVWSYSVTQTGNISRVKLKVKRLIPGLENVYAFNYAFYFQSSQVTLNGVAPGALVANMNATQLGNAVDWTNLQNNLGWAPDGTGAIAAVSNPPAPLPASYNRVFIGAVADGNFEGEDIGVGEVVLLDVLFDWTPGGGPASQDSVYIASGANLAGLTYTPIDFSGEYNIVTFGTRLQPLPIILGNFDAQKYQERSSLLEWTTLSESNSSHFVVERSFDKNSWSFAGKVDAAGNSQIIQHYSFVDKNVYNGIDSRKNVYYRLVMYDIDGQSKYSPIKSVEFRNSDTPSKGFAVYPNPASDGVHVEWDANQVDQPTALEFYDIAGKLVHSVVVSNQTNQQYVDFGHTNIQAGLYLMRVMNGDQAIDHEQIVVGKDH